MPLTTDRAPLIIALMSDNKNTSLEHRKAPERTGHSYQHCSQNTALFTVLIGGRGLDIRASLIAVYSPHCASIYAVYGVKHWFILTVALGNFQYELCC